MIIIGGKQVTPRELSPRFPSRGIESECLQTMHTSASKYTFNNMDELEYELTLRREIVSHSLKLLRSGMEFEVFRQTYCNQRYWIRTSDGGFDLRRGVSPSAAVRDIYTNGKAYGTECATAMQIVYYGALLSVMGDAAFDRAFGGISLMNWHKLSNALQETGLMRPISDALPGDRRYFANPDVNLMTPEWQGENVIDLGDGTYYGHGLGRASSGDHIITELNQNRKPNAGRGAYLMPTAGRPNFAKLYRAYGETAAVTTVSRMTPARRAELR